MKDFATKLKELLKKRNISQSELARGVKLSRSSISHYVNGNIEPTHNNIVAIARYLNVPVSYFLDNYNDDSLNYEIINETLNSKLSIIAIESMIESTKNKEITWGIDETYNLFVQEDSDELTRIGYVRKNNSDFYFFQIDKFSINIEFDENNEFVLKLKELYDEVEYLEKIYPKTTPTGITVIDSDNYKVRLIEELIYLTTDLSMFWIRSESNPNEFTAKFGEHSFSIAYEKKNKYEFYTYKNDDVSLKRKFYENDLFTLKLKELYDKISSPNYPIRKYEELDFDIDKITEFIDKFNEKVKKKIEELDNKEED